MSQQKLINEIINLSKSNTWEQAKKEWELFNVYEEEEPTTCLCGHFPIIENCIIRNTILNNYATVGNCCVKKFLNLQSDDIFRSIKKVKKDRDASISQKTLEFAYLKDWITDWEYTFYSDILRKRNLSLKQLLYKNKVNEKVLLKLKKTKEINP